jgi:hypothetical protein
MADCTEGSGPWLAAVTDRIDPASLTDYDLPAYLRACDRVRAWDCPSPSMTSAP